MAKISKSGIAPLQQIKSEHLIRIIDALSGEAPDTQIEVSGSISSSFIGDGSLLINLPTSSGYINFVPISGTISGNPIIGDIISLADFNINSLSVGKNQGYTYIATAQGYLEDNEDKLEIKHSREVVISGNPTLKGLKSPVFYNKQNDPLVFVQLGDILGSNNFITSSIIMTSDVNNNYYAKTIAGALNFTFPPIIYNEGKIIIVANKSFSGNINLISNSGSQIWAQGNSFPNYAISPNNVVSWRNDGVTWTAFN
jgi:hypothetical protein